MITPFAHAMDACPTRDATLTIPDPAGVMNGDLYVLNDCHSDGCLFSIEFYQESNGIPGLQPCGGDGIDAPDCLACSGDRQTNLI